MRNSERFKMAKLNIPPTIKMIITDFDGIITDNCVYIDNDMQMSRKINFKDVMAISILKKNKIDIAIISGEKNAAIEILAKKFEIKEIHQDIRKKIEVLKSIITRYNLKENEYLYAGDDVNDVECLTLAKIKITVPQAVKKVHEIEGIQITESACGNGAFREIVDCLTEQL